MNTGYDWLAIAAVAAIAALFAHRHAAAAPDGIALHHYLIPAAAMALMNILGNGGETVAAIAAGIAGVAYAIRFLRAGPDPLR